MKLHVVVYLAEKGAHVKANERFLYKIFGSSGLNKFPDTAAA
jgi:hypothetical protein